jgi:exosortase
MTPVQTAPPARADTPVQLSLGLTLQVIVAGTLLYLMFRDVLVDLALDWWNVDAYSHGMLLPPLAAYVAWLSRDKLLAYAARPDTRGLLVVASACILYLLGRLASEFFLTRMSFVVLLAGVIWTFWGSQRLRVLAFPFVLLAAMIPLPALIYNSLAAPLQLLASDIAAQLAQAAGVSVFRDGNILQLAQLTLGVAEACSGLNSLSALIAGAMLLGYLLCSTATTRTLLILLAVPLAIGVNIFRVAGTAVLADYNEAFALGFYHTFSGWLVFVAGFGLLYFFARGLHVLLDPRA